MNFLVVLICVSANYIWKRDLDRFDDSWFFSLRRAIEERTFGVGSINPDGWRIAVLLLFVIPLLVLALVLWLVSDLMFGLLTLLVHIFVLLVAIDRTQPGLLAEGYLQKWKDGDLEACHLYLQQYLSTSPTDALDGDFRQLHRTFSQYYTYRCFEKMFVMLFWYVLVGPLAVMVCYIAYQIRDGSSIQASVERDKLVVFLIMLLEWIPLRLLGLTFCLAGDFESCFVQLKKQLLSDDSNTSTTVYTFASSALGLDGAEEQASDNRSGADFKSFQNLAVIEIDSLQALLERSQIIWVCFLALVTIFGWRF